MYVSGLARRELCVPPSAWAVNEYRESYSYEEGGEDIRTYEFSWTKGEEHYVLRSEAETCALKHHGSKEALVAAQKAKAVREAKAAATRDANKRNRQELFNALVDEVGVDVKWLEWKSQGLAKKAIKQGDKYVNCGGDALVAVRELCTVTFLVSYTPYRADLQALYAYTRGELESCELMERLALRGMTHDGNLPGWWPWLQWTPAAHKFALDNFKAAVRTFLLVNNRNAKHKGLPVLHTEVLEAVIKAYAAAVVSNCRKNKD